MVGGWWVAVHLQPTTATAIPTIAMAVAVAGACLGALAAMAYGRRPVAGPLMLGAALALLVVAGAPSRAWAHDPGQGPVIERVRVRAVRSGSKVRVEVDPGQACGELEPRRIVARRAGSVRAARLSVRPDTGCEVTGTMTGLTDGSWFIYAEMTSSSGRPLETWVHVRDGASVDQIRDLYAPARSPARSSQVLAGATILAIVVALLVSTIRLARAPSKSSGQLTSSTAPVA